MNKPTVIDLFAGCGGMTQGFVDAGFEPVAAVEFNLAAAATYAANFDPGQEHTFYGDIAQWRGRRITDVVPTDVDVVIGGPPCQGFSNLGTRDLSDPRNHLWREYIRIVRKVRPKFFVIENVDRFLTSDEFRLLKMEVETGSLTSYEMTTAVLNAADYGVPQRRRRTIVIASRVGRPTLPTPTHGGSESSRPWETVRSAIGEIPFQTGPASLPDSTVEFFGETIPGIFKGMDLHLGRNPQERSLLRYDCIPPGGGRFDLPDELMPRCWRDKPTGTTDVMGRMRWDQPSLTIRTEFFKPEKGQYLHPEWHADKPNKRVNRPITHLEAAQLQTFPEDFLWCGPKIEIARQIGNAVPPLLARAIAGHLRARYSL